jgi:hypothetical protein
VVLGNAYTHSEGRASFRHHRIANLKTVTRLSIMRNPIANKKHYREFTIYKMPQLVLLDFRKIKDRV